MSVAPFDFLARIGATPNQGYGGAYGFRGGNPPEPNFSLQSPAKSNGNGSGNGQASSFLPDVDEDDPSPSLFELPPGIDPAIAAWFAQDPISPLIGKRRVPKTPAASNDTRRTLDGLGQEIVRFIDRGNEAVKVRRDTVLAGRKIWEGHPPEDRPLPLGNYSANVRTPLTRVAGMSIHAYLYEVSTGIRPYVRIEPMPGQDTREASSIENLLDAQLTEQMNYAAFIDEFIEMGLRDGTAVGELTWVREIRKVRSLEFLTPELAREQGFNVPRSHEKAGSVVGVDSKTGQPVRIGQLWYREIEEPVANRPNLRLIDVNDWVMWPSTSKSIKEASMCGYGFHATIDDLRHGAKDGLYDERQVRYLESRAPKSVDRMDEVNRGKGEEDQREGIDGDTQLSLSLEDHGYMQMYNVVYRYDGDKDDLREDWLFTLEHSTGTIIRARPLDLLHGERPFFKWTPFIRAGRFFGDPLPHLLKELQVEDDTITNQGLDAATLGMIIFALQKKTSRTKLSFENLHPGINPLEVDDTDDVKFEYMPQMEQGAFRDTQFVRDMADRLTAANDTFQGQASGKATLGEVNQALVQGSKRLKVLARRLQDVAALIFAQMIGLNRQYLDKETEFALTRGNQRIFGQITPDQLRAKVGVKAHGDTLNTNEQLGLQTAEKVYMLAKDDPEIIGDPVKRYHVQKYVLSKFHADEYEDVIGTQQEAEEKKQRQAQQPKDQAPPPNSTIRLDPGPSLAIFLAQHPSIAKETLQNLQQLQQMGVLGDGTGQVELAQAQAEAQLKAKSQAEMQRVQLAQAKLKNEEELSRQRIDHDEQMAAQSLAARSQAEVQRINAALAVATAKLTAAKAAQKNSNGSSSSSSSRAGSASKK